MSDLIKLLERFNRKERHFLALQLIGKKKFQLNVGFKECLYNKICVEIPDECVFVAIDYHLDWVLAALEAHKRGDTGGTFDIELKGTNLDIDCLIAFPKDECFHLIFLEAKAYPENGSGWTNAQMKKKAKRLGEIFGNDGCCYPKVKPHFLMLSPKEPGKRLNIDCWPCWMKKNRQPRHLTWDLPSSRLKATQCNAEGDNEEGGDLFRIDCVN